MSLVWVHFRRTFIIIERVGRKEWAFEYCFDFSAITYRSELIQQRKDVRCDPLRNEGSTKVKEERGGKWRLFYWGLSTCSIFRTSLFVLNYAFYSHYKHSLDLQKATYDELIYPPFSAIYRALLELEISEINSAILSNSDDSSIFTVSAAVLARRLSNNWNPCGVRMKFSGSFNT